MQIHHLNTALNENACDEKTQINSIQPGFNIYTHTEPENRKTNS